MTKRSIEEIDREIKACRQRYSEILEDDMYYDGRFYRWIPCARVSELNRITRHVNRLFAERNQACFRDWTKHINKNSIL